MGGRPVPSQRVVLIGASNVTRGFAVLTRLIRSAWPAPVEILGAFGHGRSYGMRSSVLGRGLPAILSCGLWRALEEAPPAPTLAVVADVGNDILYGAPPEVIVGWVRECVTRLVKQDARVLLTSLPPTVASLSRARFLAFRTIFFPARHLTYEGLRPVASRVDAGLRAVAAETGAGFVDLRPEWYGFDPIHVRPTRCRAAWREILSAAADVPACPRVGLTRSLLTYRLLPEEQSFFGREVRCAQPCATFADGSSIALY
jgi:hypothetical protein